MNKGNLDIIRTLLGLEVKKDLKFATDTLLDGTKIETPDENFVVGSVVYVVNEDGSKSLAPAGIHETEGAQIELDPNGTILNITAKQALEEEPTKEKPIAEEVVVEIVEKIVEEKMGKVKQTMELFISELEAVKNEMGKMKDKYETFSKQPAAKPITSLFKEDKKDIADKRMAFLETYKTDLF